MDAYLPDAGARLRLGYQSRQRTVHERKLCTKSQPANAAVEQQQQTMKPLNMLSPRLWTFGGNHMTSPAQGLEVIVGVGDLVTFGCALALVFSPLAGASYTLIMGYIMVANQACLDCIDCDQLRRFPSRAKAYLATCSQLLHPQFWAPASAPCFHACVMLTGQAVLRCCVTLSVDSACRVAQSGCTC